MSTKTKNTTAKSKKENRGGAGRARRRIRPAEEPSRPTHTSPRKTRERNGKPVDVKILPLRLEDRTRR